MNYRKITALFLCLFAASWVSAQNKSQIIAHRGYWNTESSSQNSLKSLKLAHDIQAYGSEFDVHLTADNVLVVFHDDRIDGRRIQDLNYADLKKMRLLNGEKLPTLEAYLKKAQKLDGLKLIFELKVHATPERNREAANRSVELVKRMGLADRTEYISFSLDACKEFIRLSSRTPVFYLNGELSPVQLKELGFAGLDYNIGVMKKHPEWFSETKKLGLKTNVWTANDPALIKELMDMGADFITTDIPVEALQIVK
ncbi:MAG: glycerophosphodiester phosphodiesterase family protein [Massilibacteroides sp.]|nr:glycerophosphodiester phosphodiesterase family protein [Massilibacteroides sp.]MDD3061271.1 glycerophosphodiester phosphodiesterase family protein [Massilibacteroides sp.]MDD4114619.1 glycerophosphodiester phosphodiesterase family protein [Massilibacteroides sp.]MDD4659768.1 glycerophosphodiester phosphodiesterase family protein [Massilibacteroides sp.]